MSFTQPAVATKASPGLPPNPPPISQATQWIALAAIAPSPFNPRKSIDKESIAELAESIKARGLLEPLVVRPAPKKAGHYELLAGHRRLEALKLVKAEGCQCTVIEADDGEARATLIVENLQRQDLGPMEEAEAFKALHASDKEKWSTAAIGAAIGKTQRFVQQRMALAVNLAPETKKLLDAGKLKVEAARVLAAAPQSLQQKVLESNKWGVEHMEADEFRENITLYAVPEATAAFDVKLYDGEWIDEDKKRYFADVAKFDALQKAAAKAKVEALKKDWPDAKLVGSAGGWVWADTGQGVEWNERKGGKATGKFDKKKATAIVWLDRQRKLRVAEGVKPQPQQRQVYSTPSVPQRKPETPEHKAARAAFVKEVRTAVAAKPDLVRKLMLLALIDWLGNADDLPLDEDEDPEKPVKVVLPKALGSIVGQMLWDDKRAQAWRGAADMKPAELDKAFAAIALTQVGWSEYDHDKAPKLFEALAAKVGLKFKPPAAPKAEAKPAPAAKKIAAKKKHQ